MMRLICLLAFFGAWPLSAAAQHLEFVVDSDNNCQTLTLQPFIPVPGTIQLVFQPGDPSVRGSEFLIHGMPSTVLVQLTPNPDATSAIGNPFGVGGARIEFPSCRSAGTPLVLYSVLLLATQPVTAELDFIGASSACPTWLDCDLAPQCTFGTLGPDPGVTTLLFPADGAVDVPLDVQLDWLEAYRGVDCCLGLPAWSLYLGTDPDPPFLVGRSDEPSQYSPAALQPETTYYWRVASVTCVATSWSAVHSFTTGTQIAVQPQRWAQIKAFYR